MSEDSGKLVSDSETKRALRNLTNLPAKRGISSILGDLLHKSEDESGKKVVHEDSRQKFSKKLCIVVDDLVKENARRIDTTKEGSVSDDKESGEFHDATVEITSGDSKEDSKSEHISFEPGDRDGAQELNADQTDVTGERLALAVLSSSTESPNPGVIGEEVPKYQNLRSFEMSKCSNVNRKDHVDQNMGDDSLKSCSCSFCLKAAYIWSDLQYQDIKSRLSALKKSQKMATNLMQRNDKRPMDIHTSVNSVSSAKLESELMAQWRLLFFSMGDILAHESNQLQNSFVRVRNFRENRKMDLEKAMKTPHHNTSVNKNTLWARSTLSMIKHPVVKAACVSVIVSGSIFNRLTNSSEIIL